MFEEAASDTKKSHKNYESILGENLLSNNTCSKVLNFTDDKIDEESKENMFNR